VFVRAASCSPPPISPGDVTERPLSARSFAGARESAATSRCRSSSSWTALRAAITSSPNALSIFGRISTSIVASSLVRSTRLMYSRAILFVRSQETSPRPMTQSACRSSVNLLIVS